jgi:hypothetical protein
VSESNRTPLIAAIAGGIIGAALTATGLVLAGPSLFGEKMVREALISNPEMILDASQALREKQYARRSNPSAPRLNGPSIRAGKARKSPTSPSPISSIMRAAIAGRAIRISSGCSRSRKGCASSIASSPFLGPESIVAARLSLAASKAGKFAAYHDALYAAGRPTQETIASAARPRASQSNRPTTLRRRPN